MQQMQQSAMAGAQRAKQQEAAVEVEKHNAMSLTDEKKNLSADIRKGIIQERLARIKEGQILETDIADEMADTSVLLQEQLRALQEQFGGGDQVQPGQAEPGVPADPAGRPQVQDTQEFAAPQA